MEERDFDIIVVGAGPAGSIAAYTGAKEGKRVLLLERGICAGSKNMTGGRIYSHSLKEVFPDFEKEAPLERKITHEKISMLDPEAALTLEFSSPLLAQQGKDSYSILRGPFDQWLASKAEEAGAETIFGIAVESLVRDSAGNVIGISAGGDTITAQVTIIADGANSLLSAQATGAKRPQAHEMAVGIKQVFELSAEEIEKRLLCEPGEGAAWLFVGDCTHGHVGGGFMYANAESISLGLVATISDLAKAETPIYQMLDDFKKQPCIAPLIKGSKIVEHSGHMVSEGGYNMIPNYVGDGCLIAGDAAMLCMNLGYMVRGIDLAVASGRMAAEAACKAIDVGNTDAGGLSAYRTSLEESFVIKDLKTFQKWPSLMEGWSRMFNAYPALCKNIFASLFVVDGKPLDPLVKRLMPHIKKIGILNLLKDVRGALKAL